MKKFFVIALLMVSVNTVMAQVVIRNNGSTVTISFNMVQYYDIPSEEIPYAQYLRPRTFFIAEVARLIPERFRYNAQYYSPMEAGQEMAMELAKFKLLKAKVAALKAGNNGNGRTAVRDSNYEARKKADAKKAAQEYAAKRDSQRTAQPRTYNDSSRTTTTTTESFASGL